MTAFERHSGERPGQPFVRGDQSVDLFVNVHNDFEISQLPCGKGVRVIPQPA